MSQQLKQDDLSACSKPWTNQWTANLPIKCRRLRSYPVGPLLEDIKQSLSLKLRTHIETALTHIYVPEFDDFAAML